MDDLDIPVLDDHLHLDPVGGDPDEAVTDFIQAGGTHLMVVNKPSWYFGVEPNLGPDFRPVFEKTVATVERASEELPGRAWPVLGVHPALISRLVEERGYSPEEAQKLMQAGLEVAAEFAADGVAVALKSGRPHYDVSEEIWEASNAVLRRALELGAETGVAVQLHTEASDDLTDIAGWAEDAGLTPERVVKHYAGGRLAGVTPSVISKREELEIAIEEGKPFMMETDFLDDPERPGAVLGPKTVPKRVRWMVEEGYDEAVRIAHIETPERVYGIDTEATLER